MEIITDPYTAVSAHPAVGEIAPNDLSGKGPSTEHVKAFSSTVNQREFGYQLARLLLCGDCLFAMAAILLGLICREWQRVSYSFSELSVVLAHSRLIFCGVVSSLFFSSLMIITRSYEIGNIYRLNLFAKNLARSLVFWSVGIWAIIGLFKVEGFTPRVGVLYCDLAIFAILPVWRLVLMVYLISPRVRARFSSRMIVIGWNEKVATLKKALANDLSEASEIIGCVSVPSGNFEQRPLPDVAVLGNYEGLHKLVQECRADCIVLADLSLSATEIQNLITFCQRELITFKLIPRYFPALSSGLQVQTMSGVPLLGVSQLPLDRAFNRFLKRSIDIVGALVGIGISSLIIPFFCTLVYLESPGPVIFKQWRTSRSGRHFLIFKIRSMRMNAESGTGAVWCRQEDTRRLKIGAFMRKWNIDELPQFFNVLRGDMSLVGPRPERPELISRFKKEIPNYNARHEVRAGLTGWAQVKGLRGDTDLVKRIEADLYYLENWSVLLDLYCIFATCFKTKNAY